MDAVLKLACRNCRSYVHKNYRIIWSIKIKG